LRSAHKPQRAPNKTATGNHSEEPVNNLEIKQIALVKQNKNSYTTTNNRTLKDIITNFYPASTP
jgi:hypothetical protein